MNCDERAEEIPNVRSRVVRQRNKVKMGATNSRHVDCAANSAHIGYTANSEHIGCATRSWSSLSISGMAEAFTMRGALGEAKHSICTIKIDEMKVIGHGMTAKAGATDSVWLADCMRDTGNGKEEKRCGAANGIDEEIGQDAGEASRLVAVMASD